MSQPGIGASASGNSIRNSRLGILVVAAILVILVFQTWRKWGDMRVDFGVQLYLSWKISTGAVLYRDVAYLTGGPLSQCYQAWLFRVFGVSLRAIVPSNLLILVLLVALVYRCFYRMSDAWTARMAGLALVLVFAFGHYTAYGIFNYVSPYSHETIYETGPPEVRVFKRAAPPNAASARLRLPMEAGF